MSAKQPPVQIPATKDFSKGLQVFTDGWVRWLSEMFIIWKRTQNYNVYDYAVPASGDTYSVPDGFDSSVLEPAGGLLTLHVVLPPTPQDRDTYTLTSTQNVATLTVTSNYTVQAAPAGLTANTRVMWRFRQANTTWYLSL